MTIDEVLSRLHKVRRSGAGWAALCPGHDDHNRSLSITKGDRSVLLHCHAGCSTGDICAALGIQVRDLFFDAKPEAQIVTEYGGLTATVIGFGI